MEYERIAQQISGLLAMVGPVQPGDVSRPASEEVVRAAGRLLQQGGESGPVLRRDHPRLQAQAEPVPA
jgi:hypothetical protein